MYTSVAKRIDKSYNTRAEICMDELHNMDAIFKGLTKTKHLKFQENLLMS